MSQIVEWALASRVALLDDDVLGSRIEHLGPPEIKTGGDPFALLVKAVVGQQLTGKAADTIHGRLVQIVGEVTPEKLIGFSAQELRPAGLSGAKADTVAALATAAMDGLDFSRLSEMSDEDILGRLTSIRGIGPWTAEMFLIFALGRPDVMSAGDLGLRKGLRIAYGLEAMPTQRECPELFERWRPYRSAACWYLWRIAEGA